ncbi:MAG: type I-E CRISPR-associated endoribonuclease Cas2 [Spirochaetia bacterium]|nr:type I-E CRISPR-associated endoribonuclease Cas2 [Spirochaetia bacterium]
MVVVIAEHLPPAIRGRMKLWFIEPKPGVFVSGLNDSLAEKVVNNLFDKSKISSGLIIFQSIPKAPWYKIKRRGLTTRKITNISDLELVLEIPQNKTD